MKIKTFLSIATCLFLTYAMQATTLKIKTDNNQNEITCTAERKSYIVTSSRQSSTSFSVLTSKKINSIDIDGRIIPATISDTDMNKLKRLVSTVVPSGQNEVTIEEVESNEKAIELYNFCAKIVENSLKNDRKEKNIGVYTISVSLYQWLRYWLWSFVNK